MTSSKVQPIRKSVVVNANVERAFALFVERFDAIKPREHNLLPVASPKPSSNRALEGISTTSESTAVDANGRGCSSTHRRLAWSFRGTSGRPGNWSPTPLARARSKYGSSPRRPIAPASSWSTDTSTVMARAGKPWPMESTATPGGRCTCTASSTS